MPTELEKRKVDNARWFYCCYLRKLTFQFIFISFFFNLGFSGYLLSTKTADAAKLGIVAFVIADLMMIALANHGLYHYKDRSVRWYSTWVFVKTLIFFGILYALVSFALIVCAVFALLNAFALFLLWKFHQVLIDNIMPDVSAMPSLMDQHLKSDSGNATEQPSKGRPPSGGQRVAAPMAGGRVKGGGGGSNLVFDSDTRIAAFRESVPEPMATATTTPSAHSQASALTPVGGHFSMATVVVHNADGTEDVDANLFAHAVEHGVHVPAEAGSRRRLSTGTRASTGSVERLPSRRMSYKERAEIAKEVVAVEIDSQHTLEMDAPSSHKPRLSAFKARNETVEITMAMDLAAELEAVDAGHITEGEEIEERIQTEISMSSSESLDDIMVSAMDVTVGVDKDMGVAAAVVDMGAGMDFADADLDEDDEKNETMFSSSEDVIIAPAKTFTDDSFNRSHGHIEL